MLAASEFKLVVLGSEQTGKSSLILRQSRNEYHEEEFHAPTIGCKIHSICIEVDGNQTRIKVWDTSGQDAYRMFIPIYLHEADCAMVCFDVTNFESFDIAKATLVDLYYRGKQGIHLILVGLKTDQTAALRTVTREHIDHFIQNKLPERGVVYAEASAKTGENVTELFQLVARKLCYNQSIVRWD